MRSRLRPAAARQPAMRVNIKGCDQVRAHSPGRENQSRRGHSKVAHYEVVGKAVKDSSVPKGRSNPQTLVRIRPRENQQPIDRPLPDAPLLKKRDPPLRGGLLSNVPPARGPLRML